MKRLILLRHAKARREPSAGDHGRPLAPRGHRNAPAMGKALRKAGFVPDAVICSAAKRARETWDLMAPQLKTKPPCAFTEALYLAPWQAIVNIARQADADAKTVMLVGHNPGLEDCATALLRRDMSGDEGARRALLAEKFPTGAAAVIDCDIDHWHDLVPACGALIAFIRPRDLD